MVENDNSLSLLNFGENQVKVRMWKSVKTYQQFLWTVFKLDKHTLEALGDMRT